MTPHQRAEAAGLVRRDLGGGCIEWCSHEGVGEVVRGATFWWWRSPASGPVKADDEPLALTAWCDARGVPR
jgi:hypothetical protein